MPMRKAPITAREIVQKLREDAIDPRELCEGLAWSYDEKAAPYQRVVRLGMVAHGTDAFGTVVALLQSGTWKHVSEGFLIAAAFDVATELERAA